MRKILLTMFATVALLGCQNEPTPVAPGNGRPISFDNVETRAGLTDLKADGFGVWAIVNNATMVNEVLMKNQYVEYNDTSDAWEYEPEQQWIDNSVFNFTATYPYDTNGTYFSYDNANADVKLTVSETPSTTDFLIATHTTDTSIENYSPVVPLKFQHALTSVGLKIWRNNGKHQNDDMRIKSVTLGNIHKGGTCTYSTTTNTWTYDGNKLTVEMIDDDLTDSDKIGAANVDDEGKLYQVGGTPSNPFGEMMLLPQTLDASSNSVSLKIVYELKRQGAADWEEKELETMLPSMTWEAGKRYTFNVVLSSVTDITVYYIQTKVDPWGTPQVGGTVIIK